MPATLSPLPPALMLQGTCSNAGKSLLAAAICRLLSRRGLNVAPFKAQNMALNSFVTADGREMGRAQALQAEACGLEADVRMNPVLLKPTSDSGSQVLVLGRPAGHMRARDYMSFKTRLWRHVRRSYRELAHGRDIMVIEGAGSPAEINLRANDIVNMRMARHAGAAVLLVADIDRGGAFAALVGTMRLLTPTERKLVAGFILNKFRGDASLLDQALDATSRLTGRPFLGIIPWISDLLLPEEDSVSFNLGRLPKLGERGPADGAGGTDLDIALIGLPHISNFTDLDALRQEAGVRVRIVRRPEHLGRPDCIILPGTKNTLADLRFLRESGLDKELLRYAKACAQSLRGTLLGICGGLQIMGESIADPIGLEDGGTARGLGLLPISTTLREAKQLRRVKGLALAPLAGKPLPVAGYEIHHGESKAGLGGQPTTVMEDAHGRSFAFAKGVDKKGMARIWGTYMHGLFDSDAFRHAWCNRLRRERGLAPLPGRSFRTGSELDRLADIVEERLDPASLLALANTAGKHRHAACAAC